MAKYITCFLFLNLIASLHGMAALKNQQSHKLRFGVILDLSSHAGKAKKTAIGIAVESFYARVRHPPSIFFKDSRGDPVQAFHSGKISIYMSLCVEGFFILILNYIFLMNLKYYILVLCICINTLPNTN